MTISLPPSVAAALEEVRQRAGEGARVEPMTVHGRRLYLVYANKDVGPSREFLLFTESGAKVETTWPP